MTLPRRMLLLSHDPAKERLDVGSALVRGTLLRAAAAADLALRGLLRPAGERVERVPGGTAPDDPFLAAVLDAVPVDRPRSWFDVIDEGFDRAEDAVLDRLERDGTARTAWSRTWTLFPVRRMRLADPGRAQRDREQVRDAVLGGHDPAGLPIADAVLALLAADGHVAVTFGIREQHRHRGAFKAVADHVESRLPGFREGALFAVAARRAAASQLRRAPARARMALRVGGGRSAAVDQDRPAEQQRLDHPCAPGRCSSTVPQRTSTRPAVALRAGADTSPIPVTVP